MGQDGPHLRVALGADEKVKVHRAHLSRRRRLASESEQPLDRLGDVDPVDGHACDDGPRACTALIGLPSRTHPRLIASGPDHTGGAKRLRAQEDRDAQKGSVHRRGRSSRSQPDHDEQRDRQCRGQPRDHDDHRQRTGQTEPAAEHRPRKGDDHQQAERGNSQVNGGVKGTGERVSDPGRDELRKASPRQLEASALPSLALVLVRAAGVGHWPEHEASPGEDRPDARQAELDRELEVLCLAACGPWMLLQQTSAEQHSVADKVAGQPETRPAREPNPVEQEHGGRAQVCSTGVALVEHQVIRLRRGRATFQRACEGPEEIRIRHGVRIDHNHAIGRGAVGHDPVHRPTQCLPLAPGARLLAHHDPRPGGLRHGGGRVCAVVSDDDDLEEVTWVGLRLEGGDATRDKCTLVVGRHEHGQSAHAIAGRWRRVLGYERGDSQHEEVTPSQDDDTTHGAKEHRGRDSNPICQHCPTNETVGGRVIPSFTSH